MDNFWLHCAKIVGTPTTTSGSWVHTFSPTDEEKLTKRGHLLIAIGLTNFNGLGDLAAIGKEIVSRLHEEYYGDLNETAFNQLKKTVDKVIQEAEEGSEFDLDISAVGIVGSCLYGMIKHNGRLIMFRQNQIIPLFTNEENGSGYLQKGDVFLLGTEEFFRLVNEETIHTALTAFNPEEMVEILAPFVHGQPDGSSAAVVFQIFQKELTEKNDQQVVAVVKEPVRFREKIAWQPKINWKEKFTKAIIWIDDFLKRRIISLQSKEGENSRSQKNMISVALILLVILTISVFFGMRQRKNSGENLQSTALLQQAKEKKEEGEALLTLNPTKAEQLFQESKNLLDKIENSGSFSQEASDLKNELAQILSNSIKEHQVQGNVFFDLELIKAEAMGDKLILNKDQLIILDKNQKAVYSLGINDGKSTILFGGEKIEGVSLIAEANGIIYALTSEGILQGGKLPELKIETDKDWQEIVDFKGFNGSLYLLDKKGEIWKYSPIEGGFSNKENWLKTETDFSQAASLAIDGSLWVLNQNGKINKLLQGQKENLNLTGLKKSLFNPSVIFTNFETEKLYILDKGNSRVVIFNKTGEYQSEYDWSEISQATDVVISESEKKIFLLIGSKIYELEIN